MSSGQKVALSLLITVLIFAGFAVAAFAGLFNVMEVRFYQPTLVKGVQKQLKDISDTIEGYVDIHSKRFSGFTEALAVKRSVLPNQHNDDIVERTNLAGILLSETTGLQGIRLIDSNGKRIHFSTFEDDVLRQTKDSISFNNYDKLTELAFEKIQCPDKSEHQIIFDNEFNRIIYSYPFYDSYGAYRGTLAFYVAASDFSRFLVSKNLITISDSATLVANISEKTSENQQPLQRGFVLGMPSSGSDLIISEITDRWHKNLYQAERLLESEQSAWIMISDVSSSLAVISKVFREDMFVFPQMVKILLLVCVFITLYLVVFIFFNAKHDDMSVVRDKIKKFQFSVINEYLDKREEYDWDQISKEIILRKNDTTRELKRSLGRPAKKHEKEVDALLQKSWDEIISALGKKEVPKNQLGNTDEIKRLLEELLANRIEPKTTYTKPKPTVSASEVATKAKTPPSLQDVEKVDEVEELAETLEPVQDVENVDEVEELDELDEVSELETVEPVDEVEELAETLEPVQDVESVDEVEEIAETAVPVQDVENVDEVEELDELDEVSELESVETVDEVEELAETLEPVQDVESVDEVEEIEELDEVSELETVEKVDEVEELAETPVPVQDVESVDEVEELAETPVPVQDVESVDEVEEIAETVEPVQDVENVDEVEEIEELDEVSELESVETVDEVEELAETLEPVQDVESVDEVEEIEELDEVSEMETVETVDEVEELAETLEPVQNVGEVEEIAETAEPVQDVEKVDGVEKIEELDEVSELETVESVDEVEELAETPVPVQDVESVDEVEEIAETVEPVQDVENVDEVEELDELDEVSELETVESVDEVEELAETPVLVEDVDEVEEIEELDEVIELESVESVDEVEELAETLEPVQDVEKVDEVEEIEELDDAELIVPVEPEEEITTTAEVNDDSSAEDISEEERNELADALKENMVLGDQVKKQVATVELPDFSFEVSKPDFSILDEKNESVIDDENVETLQPIEESLPFSFAIQFENNNVSELLETPESAIPEISDDVIVEQNGIFTIGNVSKLDKKLIDSEFQKLVDSVLQ